jgi:hypothetical protein
MKRLFTYSLFFWITVSINIDARAQWAVGLRSGANLSTMDFTDNPEYRLEGPTYIEGFHGGLVLQYISQPHLGIQFELNYSQQGWGDKLDTATNTKYRRRINYIQLPFLAHAYIGKRKFRMNFDLGPYGAYALSSREYLKDETSGQETSEAYGFDKDDDNRLDYGLIAGAGFEYKFGYSTILATVRYALGFGNISNVRTTESETSQNRVLSISVGYLYMFGEEKKPKPKKGQP